MAAAFSFKFDTRQLVNTYKWLGTFDSVTRNPQVMDVGVKYLGRAIDRNFKAEGTPSMGGSWRELSEMTQDIRRQRGYNPKHPILQQSGQLRDVSAGTLLAWGVGTGRAAAAGTGIKMAAWTGQLAFTAKVSGAKVANQYGGQTEYTYYPDRPGQRGGSSSDLPARPFFGLTQAGTLQARDAIIRKIMTDWARRSGQARRA